MDVVFLNLIQVKPELGTHVLSKLPLFGIDLIDVYFRKGLAALYFEHSAIELQVFFNLVVLILKTFVLADIFVEILVDQAFLF